MLRIKACQKKKKFLLYKKLYKATDGIYFLTIFFFDNLKRQIWFGLINVPFLDFSKNSNGT